MIRFLLKIGMLLLLLIISPFFYNTPGNAEEVISEKLIEANVSSIIDLETIEVNNGELVKMYGVNSDYYREYIKHFKQDNYFETETGVVAGGSKAYFKGESIDHLVNRARLFYERLLIGKNVYLKEVSESQSYIIYLDKDKKQSLNQLAVKSGFLVVSNDFQEIQDILIQQEEARTSKTGLWNIIVYITDKGGWGDSNFVYFAFASLIINFILSMIVYLHYIKSRSFFGMIAVYATLLTTTSFITNIYIANEKQLYFWAPPAIVVIFALIGVMEFVLFVRSNSRRSLIFVSIEILLFVMLVVVGFGCLYQGYSNNARAQAEISYSPPDYEYFDNVRIEEPNGNYIAIPENEYTTLEMGEINYANMKNKNYQLSFKNALYFSAATFFTVGYGDFSPKGFLKTVTIIQMLIGYLSQVVLFSLVVSKVASTGTPASVTESVVIIEQPAVIPSRRNKKHPKKASSKYIRLVFYLIIIIENLYLWTRA